jgi:long-subunit acyl-CoA synthetase (AMP-forming)
MKKIAEDEILCKGPNVMMVTRGNANNEVLIDGYFHTGDIGTLTKTVSKIHGSKEGNVQTGINRK